MAAGSEAIESGIISGARALPHAELMQRAARAARGFKQLGIGENDCVALVLRNDFTFFEASFGAEQVGAFAVPVNWHFTADEAGYIIEDCRAKAVVVHADLLPRIAAGIPKDVPVLVASTPQEIVEAYGLDPAAAAVPAGAVNWEQWLQSHEPLEQHTPRSRIAVIYTSGTTGRPKGVLREPLTPAMGEQIVRMIKTCFGFAPGEKFRTVVTGPMYHSAPNLYGLNAARSGGLVVLQPRYDAKELLALVHQHRITHLHMVPTMFVRMLKMRAEIDGKYDLSSLQFVTHAAAPCPPTVKREMIEWWGPIINEYYGSTETGGVIFHTAEEALAKPGTVGRAIDNGVVKIMDDEGRELPPGEVGNVYLKIRGYPDFDYIGRSDERVAMEREGLLAPGDVGYLDEDGYLFLCDRSKDMVISGGVNIYPAEIEAALLQHPGIQDCAVFGIPDEEFGESLAAYVQRAAGAGLSEDDVRAFAMKHLAKYKTPKLVKFVDSLPREDSGKLFKRKLRAPYWDAAGRQI